MEQELLTLPESGLGGLRVARSLVFCVVFHRLFVLLSFVTLCFPSFFDVRILITPLVSSNSFYNIKINEVQCNIYKI